MPCPYCLFMPKIKYRKEHIVTSVVAVIVDDDGQVLLTRRNIPPFHGLWVMPGGKIDLGEPIIKALHREVMEEVGLEVEVQGLVDVFEHLTPGDENDHFVILYYRCRPLSCWASRSRPQSCGGFMAAIISTRCWRPSA